MYRPSSVVAILLGLTLGVVPALAQSGRWLVSGPSGGRISALSIDPGFPARYYAASDDGVVTSVDRGSSWRLAHRLEGYGAVLLELDRINPAIVYVVYERIVAAVPLRAETRLFISRNGGASWSETGESLPPGTSLAALAVDPQQSGTVYAGSRCGIHGRKMSGLETHDPATGVFKSTDSGVTWTSASGGLQREDLCIDSLAIDPLSRSTLFARGYIPPAVGASHTRSTDGGGSWSRMTEPVPTASILADPLLPSRRYAIRIATVVRSSDHGATWKVSGQGLPPASRLHALAIHPLITTTLLAGTRDGIYLSTDGAGSWSRLGSSPASVILDLDIDPLDPAVILVSTPEGLFRSRNGGTTWGLVETGQIATSVADLAVDPQRPWALFALVEELEASPTIFRSNDAGREWEAVRDGLPRSGARIPYALPAYPAISVARDGATYVIIDQLYRLPLGGRVWERVPNAPPFPRSILADPTASSTLHVVDFDGYSRSIDGGESWRRLYTPPSSVAVRALAVSPANASLLFLTLSEGGVLRSSDSGISWFTSDRGLPLATPIDGFALSRSNSSTAYAYACCGKIFKTADRGDSWQELAAPSADTRALVADPVNANVVYARTLGSGIFRSADAGMSWTPFNTGLTKAIILSLATDSSGRHLYAGAYRGGVFRRVEGKTRALRR